MDRWDGCGHVHDFGRSSHCFSCLLDGEATGLVSDAERKESVYTLSYQSIEIYGHIICIELTTYGFSILPHTFPLSYLPITTTYFVIPKTNSTQVQNSNLVCNIQPDATQSNAKQTFRSSEQVHAIQKAGISRSSYSSRTRGTVCCVDHGISHCVDID